jgi:hypothetical protein
MVRPRIEQRETMTGLGEMSGHRLAHDAEADEADRGYA